MQRRQFLKRLGPTVGVIGVGGTNLVIATPEHEGEDKYLSEKKEIYKHLYLNVDTPEDVIKKAIEVPHEQESIQTEANCSSCIPKLWVQHSLDILNESLVIGTFVNRDLVIRYQGLVMLLICAQWQVFLQLGHRISLEVPPHELLCL